MTRQDYINRLRKSLSQMPQSEIEDIIMDYEEHFEMAMMSGKTEEEIAESLGSPESIAKQFKVSAAIKVAEESKSTGNLFRAVMMTISLSFFNIVFLLGPFFAVVGILIAFFAVGLALLVSGGAIMLAATVGTAALSVSIPAGVPMVGLFAMGVVFAGIGFLIIFGMIHVTRVFYDLTLRYLKANVNLIRK